MKNKIEQIKNNGYKLDFGTVFNHAFENYKKIALYAGMIIVVLTILGSIIFGGVISAFMGVGFLTDSVGLKNLMKVENLSGTFLIFYVAGVVLLSALFSPIHAGFLKMADCGEHDKKFDFSTIFEFYKTAHFKELFIATLLISGVSVGISTLLNVAINNEFIGVVISYAVSFLTFLTIPLIIFGNLTAIDAIKSSIVIVTKQPLVLLGLLIVAFIGGVIGIFGCCIGAFFTFPFVFSMTYSIYNQIIGFENKSELDEIGTPTE